jgi:hypothetical protein
MLQDIGTSTDFLDITLKAQGIKAKVDKLDYMNLKCFCIAKKTLKRKKRHSKQWDNIAP